METEISANPLIVAKEKLEKRLLQHNRFTEALQRIESALLFPTDAKMLFIIGPSGVGKTRLYRSAQIHVEEMVKKSLLGDPERIPHVAFEVPDTQIGNFNWKAFYRSYLEQLHLPLHPDKKVLDEITKVSGPSGQDYVLMKALEHRRPVVTFLDEANHLCQVTSGQLLRHQMDKIKSLANRSNVLHVCFGTYDLVRLVNLSSQLARRSEIFHFGRYRMESEEDMKHFGLAVNKFKTCLPLAHNFDLGTHIRFLHERTIGCVGTLKTWLMEALARAYRNKRREISFEDLQETAMPLNKLQKMLDDALESEGMFEENEADHEIFLTSLGHKDPGKSDDDDKSDDNDEGGLNISPRGPNNRPVAGRNPNRDATGTAFNNHGVRKAS